MDQSSPAMAPPVPWESTPYVRPRWIRDGVEYGETVEPPNDQKSNNEIRNEEVLQPRNEPIGTSHAFPIRGVDQASAEPTHKLNQFSNNSGVPL